MHEADAVGADQLGGAVAQLPGDRAAHVGERALLVDDEDDVAAAVVDGGQGVTGLLVTVEDADELFHQGLVGVLAGQGAPGPLHEQPTDHHPVVAHERDAAAAVRVVHGHAALLGLLLDGEAGAGPPQPVRSGIRPGGGDHPGLADLEEDQLQRAGVQRHPGLVDQVREGHGSCGHHELIDLRLSNHAQCTGVHAA